MFTRAEIWRRISSHSSASDGEEREEMDIVEAEVEELVASICLYSSASCCAFMRANVDSNSGDWRQCDR